MKKLLLNAIKGYQKTNFFRHQIFKNLFLSDASCRFIPTCSHYSYEAIEKYGVGKGLILSFKRIIRCHPFSSGGYDPLR